MSAAWATEATTDAAVLERWWKIEPDANIILATGRVFDVLDVPADTGTLALARMDAHHGFAPGPVASVGGLRTLFFVATRSPVDEDEWWSCSLDCVPETVDDSPGLRWHCRDSYVPAPGSVLPGNGEVTWIRSAFVLGATPPVLPDPIAALSLLADVYEA